MSKSVPTVLDVFLECLHIIQELPPDERASVIGALENFKMWSPNTLRCPPRVHDSATVERAEPNAADHAAEKSGTP